MRDDVSFRQVERIIRDASSSPLVIVLSAMGKTTNALELVASAAHNEADYSETLQGLRTYHLNILNALFPRQNEVFAQFEQAIVSLHATLNTSRELPYAAFYDRVVSYGEKISTLILHQYLAHRGLPNTLLDAAQLVVTDGPFRKAVVDWEVTKRNILNCIEPAQLALWVVAGFIGSDKQGHTVTLGREGSDFSAAIFASALDASELTIWKDVPGVLNVDPNELKAGVKFDKMPYNEAVELSFYGAKVIHPNTIKPLENRNIPLFVRPFSDPAARGTLISSDPELHPLACSIIRKKDQILLTLIPKDMSFISEGHVHSIMGALCDLGLHINLMQSSALHFSLCLDNGTGIVDGLGERLGPTFHIRYNEHLTLLTLRRFSEEDIQLHTRGQEVVMEQRSRIMYQAVLKD